MRGNRVSLARAHSSHLKASELRKQPQNPISMTTDSSIKLLLFRDIGAPIIIISYEESRSAVDLRFSTFDFHREVRDLLARARRAILGLRPCTGCLKKK